MDKDVVGKRKKQLREYPNPLFVCWLKEWADDAAAKGTKSQYTYKKVNTPNIVHSVTLAGLGRALGLGGAFSPRL